MDYLLFLILINDLPIGISSTVSLFDNEYIVYRSVISYDDSLDLQHVVEAVELVNSSLLIKKSSIF